MSFINFLSYDNCTNCNGDNNHIDKIAFASKYIDKSLAIHPKLLPNPYG